MCSRRPYPKSNLLWRVEAGHRRQLAHTRLGRRGLRTDRPPWSTGRIGHAFRGQWHVAERFLPAKHGGLGPWGPASRWAAGGRRLHPFAPGLGLTLVSRAKLVSRASFLYDDAPVSGVKMPARAAFPLAAVRK